jgi:hypothetical protein
MTFITVVLHSFVDYLLMLWVAQDYTTLNDRMVHELKACGRRLIEVLSRYLARGNEESHENSKDS